MKYRNYLILFAFAFLTLSNIFDQTNFSVYQGRDIQRSLDLLKGNFIWHGSELSGGGYTPGPFYYWLMAPTLYLFGSWQSLVWFNITLSSLAAVLFWSVGIQLGGVFSAYLLFLAFLASPYLTTEISAFWNPSFLPIFIALALLWGTKKIKRKRETLRMGFLMGLAIQIHYGALFPAVGYLVGIFWDNKRDRIQHSLYFSFGVILTMVPYLIWMASNQSNEAIGETGAGIMTLLRPFNWLSKDPLELARRIHNNFSSFNENTLRFEVLFWELLTVWAYALFLVWKGKKVDFVKNNFLWAALFVSSLGLVSLAIESSFSRYLLPWVMLFYVSSVPLIEWLEKHFKHKFLLGFTIINVIAFSSLIFQFSNWRIVWDPIGTSAVLLMGMVLVYTAAVSKTQRYILAVFSLVVFTNFQTRSKPPNEAHFSERLFSEIKAITNWNYEKFRSQTYLVGFHAANEQRTIYDQAQASESGPKSGLAVDGILIVNSRVSKFFEKEENVLVPDWQKIKTHLPDEIVAAGENGDIRCIHTSKNTIFEICYYRFVSAATPNTWNNIGSPYSFQTPLLEVLRSKGVTHPRNGEWIFYINSCSNFEPACSVYFVVRILSSLLSVRVLGDPLTVASEAPNPSWHLILKNPSLELTCDGKPFTHRIASDLGRRHLTRGTFSVGFFTPYETHVQTGCRNPERISLYVRDGDSVSKYGMRKADFLPFNIEWTKATN